MATDDERRDSGGSGGEPPSYSMPFRLRGFEGRVSLYYGVNRDPEETGFQHLGLPFDLALTLGYPTLRATIAYAGKGYNSYMGWIQVITNRDPATGASESSVDLPPIHWELDTPFAAFGAVPPFFDAPANPDHETEDWVADAFLAVCPDIAKTRRVAALLGFRWGYALRQRRATPLPLASADASIWDQHLPLLRGQYPTWEFLPGFADNL